VKALAETKAALVRLAPPTHPAPLKELGPEAGDHLIRIARRTMRRSTLARHEGRTSTFVPFSRGYSLASDALPTGREGLIHAN
jgi:hypothetical protein